MAPAKIIDDGSHGTHDSESVAIFAVDSDSFLPTATEKVVGRQETVATEDSSSSASDAQGQLVGSDGGGDEETLLSRAADLRKEGRILEAARLLRRISESSSLRNQPLFSDTLERARRCEEVVATLGSPLEVGCGEGEEVVDTGSKTISRGGWIKQGECHGRRRSLVYYRMEEGGGPMRLRVRVETPIEPSLLVPLLSVLNESELYATWLPSWTKPVKLGVSRSEKLSQNGRADQTVLVTGYLPWPLSPREVVIDAMAFDDIDAKGLIGVQLSSLETGNIMEVPEGRNRKDLGETTIPKVVPPPTRGAVRVDFDGGFLFRQCPSDHPLLQRNPDSSSGGDDNKMNTGKGKRSEEKDEMLLVTFSMFVDVKVNFMPASVINFVVRTVIGRMWDVFLRVAEEVRDGKRPKHGEAIDEKRESLYNWVEERVWEMFEQLMPQQRSVQQTSV